MFIGNKRRFGSLNYHHQVVKSLKIRMFDKIKKLYYVIKVMVEIVVTADTVEKLAIRVQSMSNLQKVGTFLKRHRKKGILVNTAIAKKLKLAKRENMGKMEKPRS